MYSCPNLVNSELRLGNFLETPLVQIHDVNIDNLYEGRIASNSTDDRYLCRGERLMQPAVPENASSLMSLPVLGQSACGRDGYPDPIRRLQDILLRGGLATRESGRGVSYCFSRNF